MKQTIRNLFLVLFFSNHIGRHENVAGQEAFLAGHCLLTPVNYFDYFEPCVGYQLRLANFPALQLQNPVVQCYVG